MKIVIYQIQSTDNHKFVIEMNMPRQQEQIEAHLELIHNSIALTNMELHQLVHNHQKFVGTVHKFNNEAKNKIASDRPKEALIYLMQAEKILEYAASCGKNIDRNLIVCVLHNEACCHQKLWELEKCSNYLEALIFNLNSHMNMDQSMKKESSEEGESLEEEEQTEQFYEGKSIKIRIQLCKYYLQFCAINSQLRNHQSALKSGKKTISIIREVFKELNAVLPEKKDFATSYSLAVLPEETKEEFQTKLMVIHGLSQLPENIGAERRNDYLLTAKHYFRRWSIKKNEQNSESIKEALKNFSIGNIMQMKPISFEENRESTLDNQNVLEMVLEERYQGNPLKIETYHTIINKALLLTMGYFTIATELRLIAAEKFSTSEEDRLRSQQYRKSEIYHLQAIIIASIYVPYDMLYMRHIYTSFTNHYNNQLASESSTMIEGHVLTEQFEMPKFAEEKQKKSKIVPGNANSRISLGFDSIKPNSISDPDQLLNSKQTKKDSSSFKLRDNEHCGSVKKERSSSKSPGCELKKHRTKSDMVHRLKSCLTPNHDKTNQERNRLKKDAKISPNPQIKTKSLQRKHKKGHSVSSKKSQQSNNGKKPKKPIQEKPKGTKDQYYKSVNLKKVNDKPQEPKKQRLLTSGRLTNKPSHKLIKNEGEKKGLKKNLDKYYF